MSSKIKLNFLNIFWACLGAFMFFAAPHAMAFPTSGTCAMLITQPVAYGQNLPATNGLNILATLTFTSATAGTTNFLPTNALYASSGPVVAAVPILQTASLSIADGLIPGSKKVTLSTGQVLTVYAVNGDKTVLVQGFNTLAQGVCQF